MSAQESDKRNQDAKLAVYQRIDPEQYDKRFDLIREYEGLEIETLKSLLKIEGFRDIILDVGSGAGRLTKVFPHNPIVGIDLSKVLINYCHKQGRGSANFFLLADMNHLPFKPKIFDKIVILGTLESERSFIKLILKMLETLKEEGALLFTYHNSMNLFAKIGYGILGKYRRTFCSRKHIWSAFSAHELHCVIKTNFVIMPAFLGLVFKKMGSLMLRRGIIRLCLLVEEINVKHDLNLGCEFKVCIRRTMD